MTNEEYIRKEMPTRMLARLLIYTEHHLGVVYYVSPDGEKYCFLDEAIERSVKWLKKDR